MRRLPRFSSIIAASLASQSAFCDAGIGQPILPMTSSCDTGVPDGSASLVLAAWPDRSTATHTRPLSTARRDSDNAATADIGYATDGQRVAGRAALVADQAGYFRTAWSPAAGATPAAFANLPMTFDDEFTRFASSPTGGGGDWMTTFPYGGTAARTLAGNHEAECYMDSSVGENPFSVANGILSITATQMPSGARNPCGTGYDSGLITTFRSFGQLYGYFEIRAELPPGAGLWPAFWLLPSSRHYTAELDAFEVLEQAPTTLYATTHGANAAGVWSSNLQRLSVPDTTARFHTYGVDWEPATTTFYMDGKPIATAATPASMDTPMFILLDLAIGGAGSWPGAPTNMTAFPAKMQVDYVRVYATANTVQVSGAAAVQPATLGR